MTSLTLSARAASSLVLIASLIGAGLCLSQLPMPQAGYGALLALWLGVASYIDIRRYLLLDVLTLPLILAGLALSYFGQGPVLLDATIGAVLGYGLLWGVGALYRRARGHDGLGLGDAKLLSAAGAWCGALALPYVMLIGSISALAVIALAGLLGQRVHAQLKIPFGPFLSAGFFTTWFLQALSILPGF